MSYTLGKASKATGKSKTTILRAIKNGTITGNKNHKGHYEINPAELHRVYKPLPRNSNGGNEMVRHATLNVTPENHPDFIRLQAKAEVWEKEVDLLRESIAELRKDRDDWKNQTKANTRLLENHSAEASNFARRGFFGLFQGKRTPKE